MMYALFALMLTLHIIPVVLLAWAHGDLLYRTPSTKKALVKIYLGVFSAGFFFKYTDAYQVLQILVACMGIIAALLGTVDLIICRKTK